LGGNLRAPDDRIENTVDYFAGARTAQALASVRPRRLIRTLAEETARAVVEHFSVRAVAVQLRKSVMPDTEFVAVRLLREAPLPLG
jgi:dihydroneopterin aldolase